jgi:UDP-4-amino-4,6-dideoxy-N-acetyl-beta-L-altrosamine N-acetyltransferase
MYKGYKMKFYQKNFEINDLLLINFVNLTDEEKDLVRNWRNHKEIRKWMYRNHIISSEEHYSFIEKLKKDTENFYWVVKNKNGEYLGVIYLNKVDFINKHAYLGIYSNPQLKGVGNILMEALKKVAFYIMKLHTLKLEVLETNKHAIEFYKKHGFKKEGILKEFVYKDGKWLDVIVMGITKK